MVLHVWFRPVFKFLMRCWDDNWRHPYLQCVASRYQEFSMFSLANLCSWINKVMDGIPTVADRTGLPDVRQRGSCVSHLHGRPWTTLSQWFLS